MNSDPERRKRLTDALQKMELDAVAAVSPQQVRMLTGYYPVMGNSLAVFSRDGEPVCVVPEDEAELAACTSTAQQIHYSPHSLKSLIGPAQAIRPLAPRAFEALPHGARVGVDLGPTMQTSPYLATERLRIELAPLIQEIRSDLQIRHAGEFFANAMAVRTSQEVEAMRRACAKASRGFAAMAYAIQVGRCENEIAADLYRAFEGSDCLGFERSFGWFFCMSGPNSTKASGAYARTRTRRIERGDLVMIHANTCSDGLWTDLTRTVVAGEPRAEHARMFDAVKAARAAALAAIRPGERASEVDHAARHVLEARGYAEAFRHATGHGVGLAAANPDARPRIHPQSPDVLEAGMTFNVEPAIYLNDTGGMRHCDVVACGAEGAEVLSEF